ncbi:hypothetical protein GF377_04120 [candidate division GN15 bacterium]|nr:hypothetical protein [candidate division GN15 bacterium]
MKSVALLAGMFIGLLVPSTNIIGQPLDVVELELNLRGTSCDNIAKNWQGGYDKYSTTGITARLYTGPLAEFSFTGEQTSYHSQADLSNFLYRFGFRVVPTSENSSTTLFFSGDFTGQNYRDINESSAGVANPNQFTSDNANLTGLIGQRLTERITARLGYELAITAYDHEEVSDRYDNAFIGGVNISLPMDMALDIEGGYEFGDFSFLPDTSVTFGDTSIPYYAVQPQNAYRVLSTDNLRRWFVSPRLSKALTSRTGVSLTFGLRRFIDLNDEAIVYGNSAQRSIRGVLEGIISPWASVYEGEYYKLQLTTHDLPVVVLSASIGFWEKDFVTTLEPIIETDDGYQTAPIISTRYVRDGAGDRHDEVTRANFTVRLPLNMHSYYMEPSLTLDYTDSKSSIVVYDYDDLTVSLEWKLRL